MGGFIPVIIWLVFWLREDKKRPEPLRRVVLVFLAGDASSFMTGALLDINGGRFLR